jgi:hypothetical protein
LFSRFDDGRPVGLRGRSGWNRCQGEASVLHILDSVPGHLNPPVVGETKGVFKMADQITTVTGIYPTPTSLAAGVQALKDAGFRPNNISVLYPEKRSDQGSAHANGEAATEGAATGASAGAVVGGVLGWLAGIGSLVIPGMGLFIAAGPILAALASAGAAGIVGGLAGGLAGLGVPESEAHGYQERLKEGGTLLSVRSDELYWTERAREILTSTGAQDISSTGGAGADINKSSQPYQRSV